MSNHCKNVPLIRTWSKTLIGINSILLFGSVGDDSRLLLWDVRENTNNSTHKVENAHAKDVNCLDFNPFNEFLLITGKVLFVCCLFICMYVCAVSQDSVHSQTFLTRVSSLSTDRSM